MEFNRETLQAAVKQLEQDHEVAKARLWEITGALNATKHWLQTLEDVEAEREKGAEKAPSPME